MALTSRLTLRRRIARQLYEPFFVRVPNGEWATSGTPSSVDVAPMSTDFENIYPRSQSTWIGGHLYIRDSSTPSLEGTEYFIYNNVGGDLFLSPTPQSEIPSGTLVELYSRVTPMMINEGINDALREAFPFFYEWAERDICIPLLSSELTSDDNLPTDWQRLMEVWLEPDRDMIGPFDGQFINSTNFQIPDAGFTANQYEGWEVRFVEGERHRGKCRVITSNGDDDVSWSESILEEESFITVRAKCYLVDTTETSYTNWQRQSFLLPNQNPVFQSIFLGRYLQNRPGYKLRLRGVKVPTELVLDSDETIVPPEYITYYVTSKLMMHIGLYEPSQSSSSTQYVGRWDAGQIDEIRRRMSFRFPTGTIWEEMPHRNSYHRHRNDGNPFNWR